MLISVHSYCICLFFLLLYGNCKTLYEANIHLPRTISAYSYSEERYAKHPSLYFLPILYLHNQPLVALHLSAVRRELRSLLPVPALTQRPPAILFFGPVKATVTAATATSLTVTVPACAQLPALYRYKQQSNCLFSQTFYFSATRHGPIEW